MENLEKIQNKALEIAQSTQYNTYGDMYGEVNGYVLFNIEDFEDYYDTQVSVVEVDGEISSNKSHAHYGDWWADGQLFDNTTAEGDIVQVGDYPHITEEGKVIKVVVRAKR